MKNKIRKIAILFFATFLFFAALETLAASPEAASINREESQDVLEVPKTGVVGINKTASTYETLFEIGFLALTGVGFYAINARKSAP